MLIETVHGAVRARPGRAEAPDGVLSGDHRVLIDLLIGRIDLKEARAKGLRYEGDLDALGRVQPLAVRPG